MQMLNEARGGTLILNLALDRPDALKHVQSEAATHTAHKISVAPRTHLAAAVGEESIMVNSFHRQAVDSPGVGLKAIAWAPDGVVEAIAAPSNDPFLVGVQFHPEALVQRDTRWRGLFDALISAARRRMT
jgi:putative glutamine amidotransferase